MVINMVQRITMLGNDFRNKFLSRICDINDGNSSKDK